MSIKQKKMLSCVGKNECVTHKHIHYIYTYIVVVVIPAMQQKTSALCVCGGGV